MAGVTSFTELMLAAGKTPSSKTISYHLTVPSQTEIEKLKLPAGEQVLRMERVRSGNDVPICYEIATVPAALVKDFSRDEITSSFYRTLEQKAGGGPAPADDPALLFAGWPPV